MSYPLEAGWKDTNIASRDDRSPVVREVGEHAPYSLWPEIARAALSISVGRRVSTTRWATVCYRICHRSAMLSLHTPPLRRVDQPLAGHGTAAGGASRERPISRVHNHTCAARARSGLCSSRTSRAPLPPRSVPREPHRASASWSTRPVHGARRPRRASASWRPGMSPRALPSPCEHPAVCGRHAGLPPGARGAYLRETEARTYGRRPAYLRETIFTASLFKTKCYAS